MSSNIDSQTVTKASEKTQFFFLSGPMFSGKTTLLIDIAEKLKSIQSQPFLAVRPTIDNRYEGKFRSHPRLVSKKELKKRKSQCQKSQQSPGPGSGGKLYQSYFMGRTDSQSQQQQDGEPVTLTQQSQDDNLVPASQESIVSVSQEVEVDYSQLSQNPNDTVGFCKELSQEHCKTFDSLSDLVEYLKKICRLRVKENGKNNSSSDDSENLQILDVEQEPYQAKRRKLTTNVTKPFPHHLLIDEVQLFHDWKTGLPKLEEFCNSYNLDSQKEKILTVFLCGLAIGDSGLLPVAEALVPKVVTVNSTNIINNNDQTNLNFKISNLINGGIILLKGECREQPIDKSTSTGAKPNSNGNTTNCSSSSSLSNSEESESGLSQPSTFCGNPTLVSVRLRNFPVQKMSDWVGGAEKYRSLCAKHYEKYVRHELEPQIKSQSQSDQSDQTESVWDFSGFIKGTKSELKDISHCFKGWEDRVVGRFCVSDSTNKLPSRVFRKDFEVINRVEEIVVNHIKFNSNAIDNLNGHDENKEGINGKQITANGHDGKESHQQQQPK